MFLGLCPKKIRVLKIGKAAYFIKIAIRTKFINTTISKTYLSHIAKVFPIDDFLDH